MTALLDGAPTPIVILLFALLIFGSIMGRGGGWRFGPRPSPLFGFGADTSSRAIFQVGGDAAISGGNSSGLFEPSSLPEERLF